jgi:hypothetical protein
MMSCCGNKRNELKRTYSESANSAIEAPVMTIKRSDILFKYVGKKPFTTLGSITGKAYHFSFFGDTKLVEANDVSGMMAIPDLEKA